MLLIFLSRTFEYFVTSRSTYNKIRDVFKLPSVRTLSDLTSKVSKSDDFIFLDIFCKVPENQKMCILLIDGVYIKAILLYYGGNLLVFSENSEGFAKTIW